MFDFLRAVAPKNFKEIDPTATPNWEGPNPLASYIYAEKIAAGQDFDEKVYANVATRINTEQ
jgi:hypothetical protein